MSDKYLEQKEKAKIKRIDILMKHFFPIETNEYLTIQEMLDDLNQYPNTNITYSKELEYRWTLFIYSAVFNGKRMWLKKSFEVYKSPKRTNGFFYIPDLKINGSVMQKCCLQFS